MYHVNWGDPVRESDDIKAVYDESDDRDFTFIAHCTLTITVRSPQEDYARSDAWDEVSNLLHKLSSAGKIEDYDIDDMEVDG